MKKIIDVCGKYTKMLLKLECLLYVMIIYIEYGAKHTKINNNGYIIMYNLRNDLVFKG